MYIYKEQQKQRTYFKEINQIKKEKQQITEQ